MKSFSMAKCLIFCFFTFVIGVAIGFGGMCFFSLPDSYAIPQTKELINFNSIQNGEIDVEQIKNDTFSIHFIELGNKYAGDCTLIKVGNVEVLVDAGSKVSSIPTISAYINQYCTDNILEYVIVTHAHEDHYAGFATNTSTDSVFDLYECKNIIQFSNKNKSDTEKMYANYLRELEAEQNNGANVYNALQCVNQESGAQKIYDLGSNVKLEILDQFYYNNHSDTENDYSVCFMVQQGSRNYLFTGDLEDESALTDRNTLPTVSLYKAGHHGSKTSSNTNFLSIIRPEIVCVSCCAGSTEYTNKKNNTFPTQDFINRISLYTAQVFVTSKCDNYQNNEFSSLNGNIVIRCNENISVCCSNNNTILKDTDWFKENRTMPESWAS